jgi:hypothetical protein
MVNVKSQIEPLDLNLLASLAGLGDKGLEAVKPANPNHETLFDITKKLSARQRAALKFGPQAEVVNAFTDEVYAYDVSLRMLVHFCGVPTIEQFMPGFHDP